MYKSSVIALSSRGRTARFTFPAGDGAAHPKPLDFEALPIFIARLMNQSLTDLSPRQLRQAADLKERIESLEHDLAQILGSVAQPSDSATLQKKRKMSAAARARIAAGARARWARIKGTTSVKSATQPKRKMSAAARASLSAMAKARWRRARAAGKNAL